KGGTADKIRVPGFVLAGKTGTAHKYDPETKHYAPDRYLSSFIGFAPADDPRLVVLAIIDDRQGGKYYGGAGAAPAFARVMEEGLKSLGVPGTEPIAPAIDSAKPRGATAGGRSPKPARAVAEVPAPPPEPDFDAAGFLAGDDGEALGDASF